MKVVWGFILSFCLNFGSYAETEINIKQVELKCPTGLACEEYKNIFNSLERSYTNLVHFKKVLKLFIANEGIQEFSYQLKEFKGKHSLEINFTPKDKVVEIDPIEFIGKNRIELPSILLLKEGDFYDERKILQTKRVLADIAKEKGFPYAEVIIKKASTSGGVKLSIMIDLKKPIKVESFFINSESDYLKQMAYTRLGSFIGKPYDLPQIKVDTEDLRKLFQDMGYYLVDLNLKYRFDSKDKVSLFLDIINAKQVSFRVEGSRYFSEIDLKETLKNAMISGKREFSKENLDIVLREKYEQVGFKFTEYQVEKQTFESRNKDKMIKYSIKIKENAKSKVLRLSFKGNTFFNSNQLKKLYYENAFEQASSNIYDPNYYKSFINILREHYISSGYVSVFVDEPYVQFDNKSKMVIVSFRIREGLRAFVSEVNINGLSQANRFEVLKLLGMNVGSPFNPILFKTNVDNTIKYLKNSGYYYSKLFKTQDMVAYDSDNTEVKINLTFNEGPKLFAGDIIIIGNYITRKRLILRELTFKKNSLVTSKIISDSRSNLMALGIFSNVDIKPISKSASRTDILIFVREKDFGSFEIAPGIRSDLGFKLSANLSYNNIDGLNKRVTLSTTFNRRFDLNSLDDERRESDKRLIEYDTTLGFSEKKILRSDFDFNMSLSYARKRFYSFDADIRRFSYGFTRNFYPWLSGSFTQQIEEISQFEATDEDNEGNFQVGSITPGILFDFRDRPVNPSSGAYFELSYELANPTFGSQDVEGESIDYYKLISRNRFYFPMGDYWILATSMAFGLQENNLGKDGYIPSIKVFRLSGADIVRGFEDEEINRLISGEDISDNDINSRAYMANLKIEPRYYLSDSTVLGIFYDAGRVFVDEFQEDKLRSSAGVSFKYITPVGTLDFDYGIKLLRKKDSSGNLETPGRLHVSIGFF